MLGEPPVSFSVGETIRGYKGKYRNNQLDNTRSGHGLILDLRDCCEMIYYTFEYCYQTKKGLIFLRKEDTTWFTFQLSSFSFLSLLPPR
jgi:hypothetical protein